MSQRIDDLFVGSTGSMDREHDPWPEAFLDFVQATYMVFGIRKNEADGIEGNEHLWSLWNLRHHINPESATAYLFENGIRA